MELQKKEISYGFRRKWASIWYIKHYGTFTMHELWQDSPVTRRSCQEFSNLHRISCFTHQKKGLFWYYHMVYYQVIIRLLSIKIWQKRDFQDFFKVFADFFGVLILWKLLNFKTDSLRIYLYMIYKVLLWCKLGKNKIFFSKIWFFL